MTIYEPTADWVDFIETGNDWSIDGNSHASFKNAIFPGVESMSCPKCDTRQPKAPECKSCGIIVNKYVSHARHQAKQPVRPSSLPRGYVHKEEKKIFGLKKDWFVLAVCVGALA